MDACTVHTSVLKMSLHIDWATSNATIPAMRQFSTAQPSSVATWGRGGGSERHLRQKFEVNFVRTFLKIYCPVIPQVSPCACRQLTGNKGFPEGLLSKFSLREGSDSPVVQSKVWQLTSMLCPWRFVHLSIGSRIAWTLLEYFSKYWSNVDFPQPIFPSTETWKWTSERNVQWSSFSCFVWHEQTNNSAHCEFFLLFVAYLLQRLQSLCKTTRLDQTRVLTFGRTHSVCFKTSYTLEPFADNWLVAPPISLTVICDRTWDTTKRDHFSLFHSLLLKFIHTGTQPWDLILNPVQIYLFEDLPMPSISSSDNSWKCFLWGNTNFDVLDQDIERTVGRFNTLKLRRAQNMITTFKIWRNVDPALPLVLLSKQQDFVTRIQQFALCLHNGLFPSRTKREISKRHSFSLLHFFCCLSHVCPRAPFSKPQPSILKTVNHLPRLSNSS